MTKRQTPRNRWPQRLIWTLIISVFLAPISWNIYDHLTRPQKLLNEKSAILQLLASKFTGPAYFQMESSDSTLTSATDKVYISTALARKQAARIASERKLKPDESEKLNDIIARMTEQPPSRVVGEERVNLLLLNLSLDAL